jgi:predicted CoA-binding protein
MAMTDAADELLTSARTVLVVDWPTPEVPATLARSGLRVFVRGGPGPDQYTQQEAAGTEIVVRQVGHAPDHADLVYSYRPLVELPDIVALARSIGAQAVWMESAAPLSPDDDGRARGIVEAGGLLYLSGPDIIEEVHRVRGPGNGLHEPGTPS